MLRGNYAHKWYVIGDYDEHNNCKPKKVVVNGSPITIWKDNNNRFTGIHDVSSSWCVSIKGKN